MRKSEEVTEEQEMNHDQLTFYVGSKHEKEPVESILSTEEMDKILADEAKYFQQEAEEYLKRYHRVKRMANTQIPSITSVWSDMPSGAGGKPSSKVEEYAIKSVSSQEWIDVFDTALQSITLEHQEIIATKYLEAYYPKKDDYVFDTLCISRSTYYRMKPEALDEFGRALHEYFYYHTEHAKEN